VHQYQILIISKLQKLCNKFSNFGNFNLAKLTESVQADLPDLINCESARFLLYDKVNNSLYFNEISGHKLMIKIDARNNLISELINGQEIKQLNFYNDSKKSKIDKILGNKIGIKISNMMSAKIMNKENLLGKIFKLKNC
jgi:hypothetical protein